MIKIALFGAGFIGKVHDGNIATHPMSGVTYIYDVNQAAAKAPTINHATAKEQNL